MTEPLSERVGIGVDLHRFDRERALVLGGVTIAEGPGLAGHSDADVLTHAIIDALLGAAAMGDIGQHFPSDEPEWAGADSQAMLVRVVALLLERGYRVGNVDATVIAERPKLAAQIPAMRQRLAKSLQVETNAVSVKATTADGLGAVGRGEGIEARAIARIVAVAQSAEQGRA